MKTSTEDSIEKIADVLDAVLVRALRVYKGCAPSSKYDVERLLLEIERVENMVVELRGRLATASIVEGTGLTDDMAPESCHGAH